MNYTMATRLPILQLTELNEFGGFINFWKKMYFYPLENLYNETIFKKQFDNDDLQRLFMWKNAMKLSEKKQFSLDVKIKSKLKVINRYKLETGWSINNFQNDFNELSAVWKIFLLHIIKPEIYPIYDQHINRTYNFIHLLPHEGISATMSKIDKEDFYFEKYLPFIQSNKGYDLKSIDEAFFSFGKFLNTNKNEILFKI